jgi:hypothetical protein
MKKKIATLLSCAALICLFYFGRSIYIPFFNKFKKAETVESISAKIERNVLERLKPNLSIIDIDKMPTEMLLLGIKEERLLHVYAKKDTSFVLLKSYPFSAYSGKLGPKLKTGDRQIPEGIYEVEYLNPNSTYYLSLRLNYPNAFDIKKTKFKTVEEMGNDIFIHGKAASIGCIPIGDRGIEEVFILVKNAIQNHVKVIITPRDFRENNTEPLIDEIDWESELYKEIKSELRKLPYPK